LRGTAKRIRLLELPGLGPKGDVADWLATGGTHEELLRLAESAPEYTAGIKDEPPPKKEYSDAEVDAEISRLVACVN
jgi:hypothetical protein